MSGPNGLSTGFGGSNIGAAQVIESPCPLPCPPEVTGPRVGIGQAAAGTVTWHQTNASGDFNISQFLTVTAPANLVVTGTPTVGATCGVRATSPAPPGKSQFEVDLTSMPGGSSDNVCVGVDGGTVSLAGTGLPSDGFVYDAAGGIFENGAFAQAIAAATSGIVSVLIDNTNGTIAYLLNGAQQGTTSTGIGLAAWYAYFGTSQGDTATANFTGPFAYPQAGYPAYDAGAAGGTTYNDNLSESAAAAAALTNAETFASADAESAAAADSTSSTQTFVNTLAESAAASDSLTGGLLLSGSLNETAAAADALANAVTWGPAQTESAAANDSLASSATFGSPLSETAATSDSLAAGNVIAATRAESAAAADSEAASQTFVSILTETAASADALSAGLVIAKSLNETAAAADSATVAVTFNPALTESSTAADAEASSQAMANALGETSAAGDAEASKETFNVSLSESAGASDSVSAGATTYNEVVNENLAALASLGVGLVLPASVGETTATADDEAARADLAASLDEQATANDNVVGLVSSTYPPGLVDQARIGKVSRLNGVMAIAAQSRSEAVAAIRRNGSVAAGARVGKVARVSGSGRA